MANLERVLLTGDVHGNTMWVTGHVLRQAKRHGCQLVLQLGDFGIWPGPGGKRFLDVVDREAAKHGIPELGSGDPQEAAVVTEALRPSEVIERLTAEVPVRANELVGA